MDLKAMRVSMDAVPFHFDHPLTGEVMDGEDDMVFYVLPPTHDKVQEVERRFRNKLLKNIRKSIGTAENMDAQAIEVLAACVEKWENVAEGGEAIPCTPQNVRRILADPELAWIKDQLQGFVNDLQNFMRRA